MRNKVIRWDEQKSQLRKLQRGVSFEDILTLIEDHDILGRKSHPNQDTYPGQQIFIVRFKDYVYYVPFVEDENEIFLKSIIPSRKLNKLYGGNGHE